VPGCRDGADFAQDPDWHVMTANAEPVNAMTTPVITIGPLLLWTRRTLGMRAADKGQPITGSSARAIALDISIVC
jgi:hypothetical protein